MSPVLRPNQSQSVLELWNRSTPNKKFNFETTLVDIEQLKELYPDGFSKDAINSIFHLVNIHSIKLSPEAKQAVENSQNYKEFLTNYPSCDLVRAA